MYYSLFVKDNCIKGRTCPRGFFLNESHELAVGGVVVCSLCHELCSSCTGPGAGLGPDECQDCRNITLGNRTCASRCPDGQGQIENELFVCYTILIVI